jgi:hypothetical protein
MRRASVMEETQQVQCQVRRELHRCSYCELRPVLHSAYNVRFEQQRDISPRGEAARHWRPRRTRGNEPFLRVSRYLRA